MLDLQAPPPAAEAQGQPGGEAAPAANGRSAEHRAGKYLEKCAPAVPGQGGHNQTFKVACALVRGFKLVNHQVLALLQDWNKTCKPPWSLPELVGNGFDKIAGPWDEPGGPPQTFLPAWRTKKAKEKKRPG
jgi:hypothetical protein